MYPARRHRRERRDAASQSVRVPSDVIAALKREITVTGRFSRPSVGQLRPCGYEGRARAEPAHREQ
jgi:hypothetical protein